MSKVRAKQITKKFAALLKERDFPYKYVYLFGSYAKGKAKKWSDIDICVVSKKFSGKNWDKYKDKLWAWRHDVDDRIQPYGIAPENFTDTNPIAWEVKQYGVRVA